MAGGERKLVIKATDMSDDMQQDAVDCALQVRKRMHTIHISLKSSESEMPNSTREVCSAAGAR